ncbi:MAG: hypothetical protein AAFV77_05980 [Planctomycetota bacterium]
MAGDTGDKARDPRPDGTNVVFESPEDMVAYLEKRYFVVHRQGMAIWGGVLSAAILIALGVTVYQVPGFARVEAQAAAQSAATEAVEIAINDQIVNTMDEKFIKPTQATLQTRLESWARRTALDELQNELPITDNEKPLRTLNVLKPKQITCLRMSKLLNAD